MPPFDGAVFTPRSTPPGRGSPGAVPTAPDAVLPVRHQGGEAPGDDVPPQVEGAGSDEDRSAGVIGPVASGRQAREWALVLQAMGIGFVLVPSSSGWLLRVAPEQRERALAEIHDYEVENEDFPPPPAPHRRPRHPATFVMPLAFALLAAFYFYATGPVAGGAAWFTQGRADALRLASEPWRMVTALTLHANAQHVLGNAVAGTVFGWAVTRRLGPGGGLLAVLAAGALGNAANALHHADVGHLSIGASTAVTGAIGVLAGVQAVFAPGTDRARTRLGELVAPLIGGMALLGAVGSDPASDLWAHLYGFGAGLLVGTVSGLGIRLRHRPVSRAWQLACGAGAVGAVAASWVLAMGV